MIDYVLVAFLAAQAPLSQAQAEAKAAQAQAQSAAPAEVPPKPSGKQTFKNPVRITADRFIIQARRQEATWTGNVRAVRGRTVLTCDRLVAFYTDAQEVRRIECVGRVEASHGDIWAKGERAEFDNLSGNLVVTGNPQARQGKNVLTGSRIIVDVQKDTIEVESAKTIIEGTGSQPLPKPGLRK